MCILSIILFLLIGVWLGRNEIAYSFADIHILDILSAKLLGGILLFAMVIGVLWSLLTDNSRPAFEAGENYILLVLYRILFDACSLPQFRDCGLCGRLDCFLLYDRRYRLAGIRLVSCSHIAGGSLAGFAGCLRI